MEIKLIKEGKKLPDKAKATCHKCGAVIEAFNFTEDEATLLLKGGLRADCPTKCCGKSLILVPFE